MIINVGYERQQKTIGYVLIESTSAYKKTLILDDSD